MARGQRLFFNGVPSILQSLGRAHYISNFQKGGSAFHLLLEVKKKLKKKENNFL